MNARSTNIFLPIRANINEISDNISMAKYCLYYSSKLTKLIYVNNTVSNHFSRQFSHQKLNCIQLISNNKVQISDCTANHHLKDLKMSDDDRYRWRSFYICHYCKKTFVTVNVIIHQSRQCFRCGAINEPYREVSVRIFFNIFCWGC